MVYGHEKLDLEAHLIQALDRYLHKTGTPSHLAPHLEESIRYSLLSPGKRIRPRLLLACAEMVGLPLPSVIPAALALEMIHCFTLIHDDLPCMDNDDFRRGLPSNHKKFGESTALLAGDALIALAIEVFLDTPIHPHPLLIALRQLVGAIGPSGVIGGQAAESLLGKNSTLADLKQIHSQKTGALFSAALLIPRDLAGIVEESSQSQSLANFAQELGLAFQVADDLEDADASVNSASVLAYTTREQASHTALKGLLSASENLLTHWGQKALGLKRFADEVARKIEQVPGARTQ